MHDPAIVSRAQGCLLGQLAGDSLGSLVEFQDPETIAAAYPDGVRLLADGGVWGTLAGQPTDDSEMALLLARSLVKERTYDARAALAAYRWWKNSRPFDMGRTTALGLSGRPDTQSQANGALMRISPLGVFGVGCRQDQLARWAEQDARLTHPHLVCRQINVLFVRALARAIETGPGPAALFEEMVEWARELGAVPPVTEAMSAARTGPPEDFMHQQGWVLKAFQNALYQLLHADSPEDGVVDTVGRGGDTDTNAAICGALLGAVHGRGMIPTQWQDCVLNCRPEGPGPAVKRPRPRELWPVDALELADRLLG